MAHGCRKRGLSHIPENKRAIKKGKSKSWQCILRAGECGEQGSPFNTVPDDILRLIYDYIDASEWNTLYRTCKRWHRVWKMWHNPFQSDVYLFHGLYSDHDILKKAIVNPRFPRSTLTQSWLSVLCRTVHNPEIVGAYMQQEEVTSETLEECLESAITRRNSAAIEVLLLHPKIGVSLNCAILAATHLPAQSAFSVVHHHTARIHVQSPAFAIAVCNDNPDLLGSIIKTMVEFCTPRNMGVVLSTAINTNNEGMALMALTSGKIDMHSYQRVMEPACERGWDSVVCLLLDDERIDPSTGNQACLIRACWAGQSTVVKQLLKHPAISPARQDNLAVREAMEFGHEGVVLLLLDCIDPARCQSAATFLLGLAIKYCMEEAVSHILQHPSVDPNAYDHLALKLACHNKMFSVLAMLVKHPLTKMSRTEKLFVTSLAHENGKVSLLGQLVYKTTK
jgi:hypothetical protein